MDPEINRTMPKLHELHSRMWGLASHRPMSLSDRLEAAKKRVAEIEAQIEKSKSAASSATAAASGGSTIKQD